MDLNWKPNANGLLELEKQRTFTAEEVEGRPNELSFNDDLGNPVVLHFGTMDEVELVVGVIAGDYQHVPKEDLTETVYKTAPQKIAQYVAMGTVVGLVLAKIVW